MIWDHSILKRKSFAVKLQKLAWRKRPHRLYARSDALVCPVVAGSSPSTLIFQCRVKAREQLLGSSSSTPGPVVAVGPSRKPTLKPMEAAIEVAAANGNSAARVGFARSRKRSVGRGGFRHGMDARGVECDRDYASMGRKSQVSTERVRLPAMCLALPPCPRRRSNLNRDVPPRLWRCRSFSSASSHRRRAWRQQDRDR